MPDVPNRRAVEETIAAAILLLMEDERTDVIRRLGNPPDASRLTNEFWGQQERTTGAALLRLLEPVYRSAVARMRGQLDPPIPFTQQEIKEAAAEHAFALAKDFTASTQKAIDGYLADYKHDQDLAALAAGLVLLYGDSRADTLAVTELTSGNSRAEGLVARRYESTTGRALRTTWQTERDGRVCPICSGLQDQPADVWEREFPDGPPAHPRCRCFLQIEAI